MSTALTWPVIGTALAFVLWSVLAMMATGIKNDVADIKDTLSKITVTVAVGFRQMDINTSDITSLKTDYKSLLADLTSTKEQVTYFQRKQSEQLPYRSR